MNLHDETFLTAYLDGELATPHRLKVEAALLADPKLAERLQELSHVRGLVSNLPRPTVDHDVSGQVIASIDNLPQVRLRRFVRSSLRSPRRVGLAAGLAAVLMILITIPVALQNKNNQKGLRQDGPIPVVHASPDETKPTPLVPEKSVTPEIPLVAVAPTPTVAPIAPLAPSEAERREGEDREALTDVLDKPGVRRLLFYVDSLDSRTLDHVEEAFQKTHRTHPFRARQRVAQSIVIDPSLPNEAVVYTVVLTEPERESLEAQFEAMLQVEPESVAPSPPELVARLTEVGDLKVWDTPSHAEPAPIQAVRSVPAPAAPRAGPVVDLDPGETVGSPLRVHPGTLFPNRTPRKSSDAPTSPKPSKDKGTVYLVWVTTRPRF
jgi:hypothetical protein